MCSSSFRLSKAAIGGRNYLGNNIFYPHDSKTGENCLLATKVMVPIDGPVRTDVGLLGSPCFEIPRTVLRDRRHDNLANTPDLAQRLRRKTIANLLIWKERPPRVSASRTSDAERRPS